MNPEQCYAKPEFKAHLNYRSHKDSLDLYFITTLIYLLTSFLFWGGGFGSLIEYQILKEVSSLPAGGDLDMENLSVLHPEQLLHLRQERWEMREDL